MTVVSALVALVAATTPASESIFDGKTLDGWQVKGDGKWTVENGAIVGRLNADQGYGMLVYPVVVKDFTLRLKFKVDDGNSGLYFRAERTDAGHVFNGFQAEVDKTMATGGIYESGGRGWVSQVKPEESAYKPGEWADMTIKARGDYYAIFVNGSLVTSIIDPDSRKSGEIGLQLHGGQKMHVSFKEMTLKKYN